MNKEKNFGNHHFLLLEKIHFFNPLNDRFQHTGHYKMVITDY